MSNEKQGAIERIKIDLAKLKEVLANSNKSETEKKGWVGNHSMSGMPPAGPSTDDIENPI